jgi:hypothetical protein
MGNNRYVILPLALRVYLVGTNAQTITTAPYPTPVSLRFPLVEYWPELSIVKQGVGKNITSVTLIRTITGIAQERFEVTDESTTYILKYSKTKPGVQTITMQSTCAGTTKRISFCSADMETTENGIQITTSTTDSFDPDRRIQEYWLAGTKLLPVPVETATLSRYVHEPTATPTFTSE